MEVLVGTFASQVPSQFENRQQYFFDVSKLEIVLHNNEHEP